MQRCSEQEFRENVAKGRVIERALARWLMSRGARILPVYDYSGLGENKAPKLEAFSATDSLVTPDLLVARKGRMQWCEVKWKESAFLFRKTNERETGINLRLWSQYLRVKQVTGCQVFLVFAHKRRISSRATRSDRFPMLTRQAMYRGDAYAPMINWPLRLLRPLAPYSDVVPATESVPPRSTA